MGLAHEWADQGTIRRDLTEWCSLDVESGPVVRYCALRRSFLTNRPVVLGKFRAIKVAEFAHVSAACRFFEKALASEEDLDHLSVQVINGRPVAEPHGLGKFRVPCFELSLEPLHDLGMLAC